MAEHADRPRTATQPAAEDAPFAVHLLDVGQQEYGDAVLCRFGPVSVLIDGAHPGDELDRGDGHPPIPRQLEELLGQQRPIQVSLLIVTHAHQDHIGCLPAMVADDILRADWALVADPRLAWGRSGQEAGADPAQQPASREPRLQQLAAALREEVRSPDTDAATLSRIMLDAATQESRYQEMLDTLAARGTRVVRYGRDRPTQLLRAFESVGLEILGPSRAHLLLCAEEITRRMRDTDQLATDALTRDAGADPVDLYRELVGGETDAVDASSRPGPAINLQSIVAKFAYRVHTFLFTGDMQFADPQVRALEATTRSLRRAVQRNGPYSFVKLAHHGSDNAFDREILDELGATKLFGICAGAGSRAHPHSETLSLLQEEAGRIRWARTDHNGLTSLTFDTDPPGIRPSSGAANDPTPNTRDESRSERPASRSRETAIASPGPETAPPSRSMVSTAAPVESATASGGGATAPPPGVVEVITKVPHVATRVTVTIDVEPAPTRPRPDSPGGEDRPVVQPFAIAGGRELPDLLFVTSEHALADNIGREEAAQVVQAVRDAGIQVEDLPVGLGDAAAAATLVRARLQRDRAIRGVVLLGGYDVIPSQRVDTLDPKLRLALRGNRDPDDFVVWSDDIYGDRDGDGLPELPVSRIPDGRSPRLVRAALGAGGRRHTAHRSGVRNVNRPFADGIYAALPGTGTLLQSEPTQAIQQPPYDLAAERIYLMLHGSDAESSRFGGEDAAGGHVEAFSVGNVPAESGQVVFTGCCWGALIVDTPAHRALPDRAPGPRTPESSIALSFLAGGAVAFLGCTGAHYSPLEAPYRYNGGPLHAAFWRNYDQSMAPAEALFRAKYFDYLREFTQRRDEAVVRAQGKKILRQYTCLGIGW